MELRVGGNLDVEVIAGFVSNEFDQFVGIAKVVRLAETCARRQIAAKRDDPIDPLITIAPQDIAQLVAVGAHAGEVGCRGNPCLLDPIYRGKGSVLGGTTGTVGDRKESRTEAIEFHDGGLEFVETRRSFGWKKLETEYLLRLIRVHGWFASTVSLIMLGAPPAS